MHVETTESGSYGLHCRTTVPQPIQEREGGGKPSRISRAALVGNQQGNELVEEKLLLGSLSVSLSH